jgi:glutamate-5-semialdehyde dehydrogenase
MTNVIDIAKQAKEASLVLQSLNEDVRLRALQAISQNLLRKTQDIISANVLDLEDGQAAGLGSSIMDRMKMTEKSIQALAQMCVDVASQDTVVGMIVEESKRPNGLVIQKQRIPLGVIGMIFESRPNVVVDGAALAIKSGNAIILKGGKEAQRSNRAFFAVIEEAIRNILPVGSVSLVETRDDVAELLKLNQYIDLMVPRGGSQLIEHVRQNASMPVVAHDKGLCHLYVHEDADQTQVIPIVLNAKTQRPGVCNAVETLLLNEKYPKNLNVLEALLQKGVEIRGCEKTQKLLPKVKAATDEDFHTEYLDQVISVKLVPTLQDALQHIKTHTSHHTEAILAQDPKAIELFLNSLDASALVVNASTRFNDGGELGLGAELGISTSKLHAYGPMGAKEMTTTRFIVRGSGQIRG